MKDKELRRELLRAGLLTDAGTLPGWNYVKISPDYMSAGDYKLPDKVKYIERYEHETRGLIESLANQLGYRLVPCSYIPSFRVMDEGENNEKR